MLVFRNENTHYFYCTYLATLSILQLIKFIAYEIHLFDRLLVVDISLSRMR